MRLFKHGDSLAIVVPDAICKKLNLKENTELEFFEVENGLFVAATKEYIAEKLKKTIAPLLQVASAASKVPAVVKPQLLTFSSEGEARVASQKVEQFMRKGEMLAVFGIDKKYYLVSSEFFEKISAKLSPVLEKEKTLMQLATESGVNQREVIPVLSAMKERGEVIEKRKGNFLLVK
ncbi:MAG: AbrB/MazE/SpoVT family DNA-binding domain-containing protein [Candidatus Micrarchaeota archaeon]